MKPKPNNFDACDDLEPYGRSNVIRGILWGLALAIPLWAIIKWLLTTR